MNFLDQPKIWKIVITIILLACVNYEIINFPIFLGLMIVNLLVNINIDGNINIE